MKRIVTAVMVSLALVAFACGGTTPDPASQVPSTGIPTTMPITPLITPPAPTAVAPASPPATLEPTESPQDLADRVIIRQADAPASYVVREHLSDVGSGDVLGELGGGNSEGSDSEGSGAFDECVQGLTLPVDLTGIRMVNIEGISHYFVAAVSVFADDAAAGVAHTYAQDRVLRQCDTTTAGVRLSPEIVVEPLDPLPIEADEVSGYVLNLTFPGYGTELTYYVVRVDSVVLEISGTDRATVVGLLDVMLANLTDTDPPIVPAPTAPFVLLPGTDGGSPQVGLLKATAPDLRLNEPVISWIGRASQDEIEQLAVEVCSVPATAGGDGFDPTSSAALNAAEAALDVDSFGQLVGMVLSTYCPEAIPAFALLENHQNNLSSGETTLITRHLVEVEGYFYVNATVPEIVGVANSLEATEAQTKADIFAGFSLHSVVAEDPSQNTTQGQVGFLQLFQFNAPIPYGLDEDLARFSTPGSLIDRLDISHVPVFLFDDPTHPTSRFHYVWVEHGIQGVIDGSDRETLERWLTAFLAIPKLGVNESQLLDERLPTLPGFAYSEFDTYTSEIAELLAPLGDVPYSMHSVTDRGESPIGFLTLAETDNADQLLRIWEEFGLNVVGDLDIDGHLVFTLEGVNAGGVWSGYVWTDSGVTGSLIFEPSRVQIQARFLAAFLNS